MRQLRTYTIVLSLLFLSCEKSIDNPPISNEIIAGAYDALTMSYYNFNPDQIIDYEEIGCHQYSGLDSINIDQHPDWDLKFRYYLYNDIVGACCNDTIGDCFGGVYLDKTIEIPGNYQIHTDTLNWAKLIHHGDVIDSKLNWSNETNVLLYRFSGVSNPGQGYWSSSNMTEPKYLGIRKIEESDTIYGWILLDTKDTIIIKEYAFNKKPF